MSRSRIGSMVDGSRSEDQGEFAMFITFAPLSCGKTGAQHRGSATAPPSPAWRPSYPGGAAFMPHPDEIFGARWPVPASRGGYGLKETPRGGWFDPASMGRRCRGGCASTRRGQRARRGRRSEEHTSELQSRVDLVCRLLLE